LIHLFVYLLIHLLIYYKFFFFTCSFTYLRSASTYSNTIPEEILGKIETCLTNLIGEDNKQNKESNLEIMRLIEY
jgi:hypothetical protein